MKFSIIVPIYKAENYLAKCVDSLLDQTYRDIEIILVDDGSPDRCPQMCDDYVRSDNRVCVVHKKNGGLSDARNAGLAVAKGEYVMFVDSDDYIELDACESFLKFVDAGYDMIVGRFAYVGGGATRFPLPTGNVCTGREYLLNALSSDTFNVAAWLNLYSRQFLQQKELEFKVGFLHEDVDFTPRAFIYARSVMVTDIVFYHYLIHSSSIAHQLDKSRNLQDVYTICMELEPFFKQNTDGELLRLLLDYEANVYLSCYQTAKKFIRGKQYVHKDFVRQNASTTKTRTKSSLFCISPWLFWMASRIFNYCRGIYRKFFYVRTHGGNYNHY